MILHLETEKLKRQFHAAMVDLCGRCFAEVYRATEFRRMIADKGGLDTAKYLINRPGPSDGYYRLSVERRLDMSVEAFVVENPRFYPLFESFELDRARFRLRQFNYQPRVERIDPS